ncbi:YdeI/OmpD-associated family protein [Sediminibacterium ginsengisoli]|uniref:Bacteriocin-protection, YdeI or OmpD-Associated n=1 Tax=Sediminibacterium ginsengisoli TaxID=413434 RepID=A0A1T4QHT1_9BACT|nr:YdeI/OmpD-associated family protein [Sediminibacterium ginsengisoli]SKA03196.1 Bacteriocin-protection, YdeI or OmpD-Associated [Sediminibacterium ginsengisoli]
MHRFTATIEQFAEQGEKTGWTYIDVPAEVTEALMPGTKKAFRVKGKIDAMPIKGVALVPMGGGRYILAINATMRRELRKKKGGMVSVQLAVDKAPLEIPAAFAECLADEPQARAVFDALKQSHRNYYIKWITGVKSDAAVAKRISAVITALLKNQDFVEMMRAMKAEKEFR